MKREDMICANCMNGELRVVGEGQIVKCFLNPEVVVKAGFERCAQGRWIVENKRYNWGEI